MNTAAAQEILEKESGLVAFNPLYAQLAELKEKNAKTVFIYSDPKENKIARSYVASLRRTKTAISDVHKQEKAQSLEYGRRLDAEKNKLTAEVEEMIEVHQKEIDHIENLELERRAAIAERVASLTIQPGEFFGTPQSAATLKEMLATIKAVAIDDDTFAESVAEAGKAKDASVTLLEKAITAAEKREADAAELVRLQKEAAEKAQRDRDEQIRRDAEDKAKKEAEARATAEREASELREKQLKEDAERAGREKKEADERAARDAEARVKAEKEMAEREAENKKLQERLAVEKADREKREAEAAIERAAQAERDRLRREEDARIEAEAKRAADEEHQYAVHGDITDALETLGIGDNQAKALIEAIRAGQVPHIQITY